MLQPKQRVAGAMSLHGPTGARKYLNAQERRRFARALERVGTIERLFCQTLAFAGGRISEILMLTPAAFDLDGGVVAITTLKRRRSGVIRHVPLPPWLVAELDQAFGLRESQSDHARASRRIWPWSRSTGWRRVKAVMAAGEISGLCAMPKGLRHTYGVISFQTNVPAHLVQRWLGHASPRTTGIYGDVVGREEQLFAERLWPCWE